MWLLPPGSAEPGAEAGPGDLGSRWWEPSGLGVGEVDAVPRVPGTVRGLYCVLLVP